MVDTNLTLYYFPKSSCSRKVLFVLEEKGIDYNKRLINLEKGEQKSNEYLKINPHGEVPAIIYDGKVIYDSAIINEFLEDQFSEHSLLPKSAIKRSQVRISTYYADHYFYPNISRILAEYRKPVTQRNQQYLKQLFSEFTTRHLPWLEATAENTDQFLFGELTLADIAFAPGLDNLMQASKFELDINSATYRWFTQVQQLPSFQKSIKNND